jgi:ABC-type lipoprotein release transport system permease subunit
LSVALTHLMRAVVFGVHTIDLVTYMCATVLLSAAACLATYLPARRAARVDPVEALRAD